MIEKMEFLSLTGPREDFDRVVERYLTKYEIHLENALDELTGVTNLMPFVEINPYKAIVSQAQAILPNISEGKTPSLGEMDAQEAIGIIERAEVVTREFLAKIDELREGRKRYKALMAEIEPFRMLESEIQRILNLRFIKFRFGKIAHQNYAKFAKYVYENLETVFLECHRDEAYVWGIYFIPASSATQVDAIFSSLHFERMFISDEYEGTPAEAYQGIRGKVEEVDARIRQLKQEMKNKLDDEAPDILHAYKEISERNRHFEIRKLAACTIEKGGSQVFYILAGWMTRREAKRFLKEIEDDERIYCIDDETVDSMDDEIKPPTKLRNPRLIRPFEMFVEMYGLPNYNEMDPTLFIALTYTLMFGIMFGDVGQGLCLTIGGGLLYYVKKIKIAAIVSLAGIWSVIFGWMYGSVFGFEDWIPARWMHPMNDIMTTLTISVVFGVALILIAMVLHIRNAIRQKDAESLLLDPSGVAGLLCYGTIMAVVALAFTGRPALPQSMVVTLIGVSLFAIFLKEPIGNLMKKKGRVLPKSGKAMFFVEAFVELFEVLLSYTTNTLSFLRVGAFALIHAGMMGVVFSLAEGPQGKLNMVVVIVGNILVSGLEALVVGIQVLRLEYYEMFSRFYKGSGKAFHSIKDVTAIK